MLQQGISKGDDMEATCLHACTACVGAYGNSGMNIHLFNNTNKDTDSFSLYTVFYIKKRHLALYLMHLARLKAVNGY